MANISNNDSDTLIFGTNEDDNYLGLKPHNRRGREIFFAQEH